MNLDTSIFFFFNNFAGQSSVVDSSIVFFAHYLAFVLVGVMVLHILFCNNYQLKQKIMTGASIVLAGLIARWGVAEPIRFLWNRPRPFLSHEVHQLLSENSYSFPSGHSTFFFALSTGIYFYNKRLGIFLYIATICMTIARIMAGVHYPSDIAAGAVVGISCAWLTYKYINPVLGIKTVTKK